MEREKKWLRVEPENKTIQRFIKRKYYDIAFVRIFEDFHATYFNQYFQISYEVDGEHFFKSVLINDDKEEISLRAEFSGIPLKQKHL